MEGIIFEILRYPKKCQNIPTFYLEKLIASYCVLIKNSKELFDYGMSIHR